MKKIKVGILTFSDGRKYIHDDLLATNQRYQDQLERTLNKTGQVEVFAGNEIIWNPEVARRESRRLETAGVDVTIFNYAIWCFPNLSAIATNFAPSPYLLFCNLHPSEPGMVGMLAAAGTLDQLNKTYHRIWGNINEAETLEKVLSFIKAAAAVKRLKGQTYGSFGGRPLGMYTTVAGLDQWQQMFGIDIEHFEQEDIVRYSNEFEDDKVNKALVWLEKHVGQIRYDEKVLTPEKLKLQIRSYYALRQIVDEKHLDFLGIKAHGDLTDHFVSMDIAEAFLNDPYDWDGPHEPIVAATENDMDGALTMQLLKHLSGEPVLFADVRHYDKENDVWMFSNSGTHATFFAGVSKNPEENLKEVTFYPEVSYYPAGGASVHHFAMPGKVTLARLVRKNGKYWMAIVPGEFIGFPKEKALQLGLTTTPEWPCAFTRINASADEFLSEYPCNHIHGIYGDWVDELKFIAKILKIDYKLFGQ